MSIQGKIKITAIYFLSAWVAKALYTAIATGAEEMAEGRRRRWAWNEKLRARDNIL